MYANARGCTVVSNIDHIVTTDYQVQTKREVILEHTLLGIVPTNQWEHDKTLPHEAKNFRICNICRSAQAVSKNFDESLLTLIGCIY
jgi:hypothetical protein